MDAFDAFIVIFASGIRLGVPLILDCLAKHDVRATFFVVGRNVELYPDRVAAIVAAGHEIAVHGYTHTPPARLTPAEEEASSSRRAGCSRARERRSPAIAHPPGT